MCVKIGASPGQPAHWGVGRLSSVGLGGTDIDIIMSSLVIGPAGQQKGNSETQ